MQKRGLLRLHLGCHQHRHVLHTIRVNLSEPAVQFVLRLVRPHPADEWQALNLAESIGRRNLAVGSLVAPVWPPTGGGSAMGNEEERKAFVTQVRKACEIAKKLNATGIRK